MEMITYLLIYNKSCIIHDIPSAKLLLNLSKTFSFLWNLKVQLCVYKSQPFKCILKLFSPLNISLL